jgi:Flp pilus assembly protein TadG
MVVFLLLTMMLSITEFCRAMYAYHFVSNAAREATRYAAVRGSACWSDEDKSCVNDSRCEKYATKDCMPNYVKSIAPQGIDSSSTGCGGAGCLITQATWTGDDGFVEPANNPSICSSSGHKNDPGCTVQVSVSYQFQFLFPFIYSSGITLSSTSAMVIAH